MTLCTRPSQGRADGADRHRLRRLHAPLLQGRPLARGRDRPARRHRRLGPHHLRLDGPQPRLQGRVPQHAGRQCGVLRQVRRQRAGLAQAGAGGGALSQPRPRQPAHRPQQAGRAGEGRLHHHPEGDRRRHLRLRRQGGGHQLGADPLQFPRPEHGPGDHRPEHGGDVHRAHEHARHQARLPRPSTSSPPPPPARRGTTRSPRASTRTTPSSSSTTPSSPGRTCSSTAMWSGSRRSTRARALSTASPCRAARGWP